MEEADEEVGAATGGSLAGSLVAVGILALLDELVYTGKERTGSSSRPLYGR